MAAERRVIAVLSGAENAAEKNTAAAQLQAEIICRMMREKGGS